MAAKAQARREDRHDDEWGDPLPAFRFREDAEREWDYCRECSELRLDGPHGWRVFVTCGLFGKCPHEHHRDEVWLAGSSA